MLYQNLTDILSGNVFGFLLVFVRLGTALMIMPGIGDSFVSERIRLLIALAVSLAVFPVLQPYVPNPVPGALMLFLLIGVEFIVGLFMGTIARIFMTALDTAGMVISMQSGLANAQLFNPSLATQGSLMGAFLTITGVVVLFATNLHHLIIMGVFESYEFFPLGKVPDAGSMAELMAKAVASSFMIGIKIAMPFMVVTLLIYTAMGVLARIMPQIQVFILVMPVQILLSLTLLSLVMSFALLYWSRHFEQAMIYFLTQVGG